MHGETVRIVDDQMAQMDNQLVALDEIVARVKAQNEEHHKAHTSSLAQLAGNVQESYQSIGKHFETSYDRTKALDVDMQEHTASLQETLPSLEADSDIREPLRLMRDHRLGEQPAEQRLDGVGAPSLRGIDALGHVLGTQRRLVPQHLHHRMFGIADPFGHAPVLH